MTKSNNSRSTIFNIQLEDAFAAPPRLLFKRLALFAPSGEAAGDKEPAPEKHVSDRAQSHCPHIVGSQWIEVIEPLSRKDLLEDEDSRFEHRTLGPRAATRLWALQHIVVESFSVVY